MTWICIECNEVFDEPKVYTDSHGLDNPPYEMYSACPYCGGSYVHAHVCYCCDKWIIGPYIMLGSGERVCENCYVTYDLGDEE